MTEETTKSVTVTEQLPPTKVAIIGTGDGGLQPTTGMIAKTPGPQPDLIVTVVGPAFAILIRAMNLFFISLSGLLTASTTPLGAKHLHAADFWSLVILCANLSLAPVGFGLVKDLVTVFGRLEGKYPLLTGSV